MARRGFAVISLVCVGAIAACSTAIDGTDQPVEVITLGAEEAKCRIRDAAGQEYAVDSTPNRAVVRRGDGPLEVACEKDGFNPGVVTVDEHSDWLRYAMAVVGFGVDFATGAYQSYPEQVTVPLEPRMASAPGMMAPDADTGAMAPGMMTSSVPLPTEAPVGTYSELSRPGGPVMSTHERNFAALVAGIPSQAPLSDADRVDPMAMGTTPEIAAAPMENADSGMPSTTTMAEVPPMKDGGGAMTPSTDTVMQPTSAPPAMAPMEKPMMSAGPYRVQIGAFRDGQNASRILRELERKGYEMEIVKQIDRRGLPWHYVRFGGFESRKAALREVRTFKSREGRDAIVVKGS